jgi:hypothetical protein
MLEYKRLSLFSPYLVKGRNPKDRIAIKVKGLSVSGPIIQQIRIRLTEIMGYFPSPQKINKCMVALSG